MHMDMVLGLRTGHGEDEQLFPSALSFPGLGPERSFFYIYPEKTEVVTLFFGERRVKAFIAHKRVMPT